MSEDKQQRGLFPIKRKPFVIIPMGPPCANIFYLDIVYGATEEYTIPNTENYEQ
jgi:hypothetical protein